MKRVKIVNWIRRIEDSDVNSSIFRFRDVLAEHRSTLITRIISDVASYIDYKFQSRPAAKELENVKESLHALKNSVLDLDKYGDLMEQFLENEMTYIRSEPFLKEIDETILLALNHAQLKLV